MSNPTGPAGDLVPGHLLDYGWSPSVAVRYQHHHRRNRILARVVRADRSACRIVTPSGMVRSRLGAVTDLPVTGDWVAVDVTADGYSVAVVLPRVGVVLRTNAAGIGEQVLAANLDTMFVLHGLDRPHRVGRLERLAILSWQAGVRPVIVLTKIDLAGSDDAVIDVDGAVREIRKVIHSVDVVATSAMTSAGIETLGPYLGAGHTVGLAGESGAGKSSLVNHLVGSGVQATGRTRRGDHKGRHTTAARELVPIPGGAVLMDTPGLRSISMPEAPAGLARSYADLEAHAAQCRFRDCSHGTEPGCALQAAIADGRVPAERWAGYLKLQKEMAYAAQRARQRERRAESKASRRRRRGREPEDW